MKTKYTTKSIKSQPEKRNKLIRPTGGEFNKFFKKRVWEERCENQEYLFLNYENNHPWKIKITEIRGQQE